MELVDSKSIRETTVEVLGLVQRNKLVGNEVRAEEIKRKRNPEKPFILFEIEIAAFLLLWLKPSMYVYKFYFYIESPVVLLGGWSLELHHFSAFKR